MSEILTVAEMAAFLKVCPATVQRVCKAGLLPGAFKVGRLWRCQRIDLERYLAGPHFQHLVDNRYYRAVIHKADEAPPVPR